MKNKTLSLLIMLQIFAIICLAQRPQRGSLILAKSALIEAGSLDTSFDGDGKLFYNTNLGSLSDYGSYYPPNGLKAYFPKIILLDNQKQSILHNYQPNVPTNSSNPNAETFLAKAIASTTVPKANLFEPQEKVTRNGESVFKPFPTWYTLSTHTSIVTTNDQCNWEFRDAIRAGNSKIYVTGVWCKENNPATMLMRWNESGPNGLPSLDTTFGGNGFLMVHLASQYSSVKFGDNAKLKDFFGFPGTFPEVFEPVPDEEYGASIVVQQDGKLVVVGPVWRGTDLFQFAVTRFKMFPNSAVPDSTFANGMGTKYIDFGTNNPANDIARKVALQGNKIVIAGKTLKNCPDCSDMAIARLNADGSLDTSFDGDGKKVMNFGANEEIYDILTTPTKIILATSYNNVGTLGKIIQLNYDGSIDWSIDTVACGKPYMNEALSLTKQTDGKILVAGYIDSNNQLDYAIARLNPDGSLDRGWGSTGYISTDFDGRVDIAKDIEVQPDGKIFVVGESRGSGNTYNLSMARYINSPPTPILTDPCSNVLTLQSPNAPNAIDVNRKTNKIYVSNELSKSVTVVDGITNATQSVAVGTNPRAVAVNEVTDKIYVANYNSNTVTVINGSNNSTTTVPVGSNPTAIAVNPVTDKIYVANYSSNNVTVIDGVTNNTQTVSVGTNPIAIGVDQTINKIYAANFGSDNVTIIDGTNNLTNNLSTGSKPYAIAVNPIIKFVYVANRNSATVTVINGVTKAIQTVPVGNNPSAIAFNIVTNKVFVANSGANSITVIAAPTNATQTIPVGNSPQSISVNEITNQVFVGNHNSNDVTAIDFSQASKGITTIAVGTNPRAIAVNTTTKKVYTANYTSNNITVISP